MGGNTSSILIKNGFLLTMTGKGLGTIEDGAVAIQDQDIVAVGKTSELIKEYSGSEYETYMFFRNRLPNSFWMSFNTLLNSSYELYSPAERLCRCEKTRQKPNPGISLAKRINSSSEPNWLALPVSSGVNRISILSFFILRSISLRCFLMVR